MINNMTWLLKFGKLIAPKAVVDSAQIGQAMIEIVKSGYTQAIINPSDILILAEQS